MKNNDESSSALADADDFDAEFREFQKEYLDQLVGVNDAIEQAVLSLAQEKNYRQALKSIKRQVHSLKGSAGSYGFHAISTICHNFEDQLDSQTSEERADDLIDRLLAYVDLLAACIQKYKSGRIYSTEELATKLIEVSDQSGNVSAAANAVPAKRHRVLVVDGSKLIQMRCRAAAKNLNIELSFMNDGYEALGRLLKERFDAVLTSAVIPTLNGQTLLNIAGTVSDLNRNIAKVLLTSGDRTDAVGGVVDHVVKKDADFGSNILLLFQKMFAAEQSTPAIQATVKPTSVTAPRRLLVIDDSQDVHLLVRIALKRVADLEIKFCKSGAQGLDLARSFKPELILLDVMMPEMDGPTVLKKIRDDAALKSIPIIFLTGMTSESETRGLNELGVAGIIGKPFNPKFLYEVILQAAPHFQR